MALANFNKKDETEVVFAKPVNTSKTLAKTFGYMAIALVVTAAVALGLGALFAYLLFPDYSFGGETFNTTAFTAYIVVMIVSLLALIIDSIAMRAVFAKGKHSIWPHYLIFAALMGVFLSSFLVLGVDFGVIAEAAGISALVFGILFLIGYFSKKDLNPLAFAAWGLLCMVGLFGILFFVLFLIIPGAYLFYNLIYCGVFALVMLISVATDCFNAKKMLENGQANDNLALYCAYIMYTDFIMIFFRVLYLLALISEDKKK